MSSCAIFITSLLIHAFLVPETHQLPTPDKPELPEGCYDPLHYLMPESRCSLRRRPVYMMVDGCPSKSVCLLDAELAACPQPVQQDASQACPAETPVRLFEYSPLEFVCPRQRCVSLDCFASFCRARRSAKADWRPLLLGKGGCDYLHCGCPATEEDLLAEGCRSNSSELLVLTIDSRSGCPVKLCTQQLPDSVKPLFPTEATSTPPTTSLLTTQHPAECPSRISCPQNTSELTVPSPEPGGCPLRICLLPELIGTGTNYSTPSMGSIINATTASFAMNSNVTSVTESLAMSTSTTSTETPLPSGATEFVTSTGGIMITTGLPIGDIATGDAVKLSTTAPPEQRGVNSTATTDMKQTTVTVGTTPIA